jgi:hypothetical protein
MTAEQPSVEALKETLSEGIDPGHPSVFFEALDSLTAALERAERERDAGNEKHLVLWRRWQDAEARAQKAEAERDIMFKGDWAALNLKLQKAEAVVEAARRLLRDADENASPEIGEFPLDAWLNLVDAVRAYDEPPTEQIPGAGQDGC